MLIVDVCVVVCVVLVVCAAVKTGVEDVSNMLLCAVSWLRYNLPNKFSCVLTFIVLYFIIKITFSFF